MNPRHIVVFVQLFVMALFLIPLPVFVSRFSPAMAVLLFLAVALLWIFVLVQSVYVVRSDTKLLGMFLGTPTATFVSGTAQVLGEGGNTAAGLARGVPVLRGIGGSDFVFLLYPFSLGYHFPTSQFEVHYDATDVWSENNTPYLLDLTLYIQLSNNVLALVYSLGVLNPFKSRDLARMERRSYTHVDPRHEDGQNTKMVEYEQPAIAHLISCLTQNKIASGALSVAREHKDGDILRSTDAMAGEVQDKVTEDGAQSVFTKIGIFTDRGDPGTAVVHAKVAVELIEPKNETLRVAQSAPRTAELNADADAIKGRGEGQRLANIRKGAQVTPQDLLRAETIQKAGANVTFVGNPESLIPAAAAQVVQPKTNQPAPAETQAGQSGGTKK